MKKILLGLVLSLCGSIALADCRAEMKAYNGQVIQYFDAYNCSDALYDCQRDLDYRQRRGMNRLATCSIAQRPSERGEWVQVDRVRYTDGKTAVAIANCKRAREADFRCNGRYNDYKCGACSEVAHSDESIYIVYQLIGGGGRGPGRPGPGPGYPDRPGRGPRTPERVFVQTFHFYHKKTAEARNECERQRNSNPQCSSRNYECTPCTKESHTDHSQYDLYRIEYR